MGDSRPGGPPYPMTLRLLRTHPRTILALGLVAGLCVTSGLPAKSTPQAAALWLLAAVAVELLWHRSREPHLGISLNATIHIPALLLLPPGPALGVLVLGSACGAAGFRRASGREVAVHVSGVAAGALMALTVFHAASLDASGTRGLDVPGALVFALVTGGYHLFGQVWAASWSLRPGDSLTAAWSRAYGNGMGLVTGAALVMLSLLAAFCYGALGFRGLLLCVMPVLYVSDGSRRYLELKRAQARIVLTERLAAKGEMAAEIGHELNNYLAAIAGRGQLIGLSRNLNLDVAVQAEDLRGVALKMSDLAKGLMDFSHRETKRTPFPVNDLVLRTVDLVRPQTRFRHLSLEVSADPAIPLVEMDPGQIQQAILTLLRRSAKRLQGKSGAGLTIRTLPTRGGRDVTIEVLESHPGARPSSGTTRAPEADPSLEKVVRIVERHHGRLEATDDDGCRMILPAA